MFNQKFTTKRSVHIPLVLVMLFVTGCASRSPISQLNQGDELSVHTPSAEFNNTDVDVRDEIVNETTAVGVRGGAGLGMLAGLACGPFVLLCMPVGFFAGGVVGGVTGMVVGASSTLDKETVEKISNDFNKSMESQDIYNKLVNQVRNRSGRVFTVREETDTNRVVVSIPKILLRSYDEGITLYMVATVELTYQDDDEKVMKTALFEYESVPIQADSWVAADESFYTQLFGTANHYLSEQIVMNLLKESKVTRSGE